MGISSTPIKLLFLFSFVLILIHGVYSAKILSISFFSRKSHKLTFLPLLEELGKRGHNITIVGPIEPTKPMKNVKEILTIPWAEIESVLDKDFTPFEPQKSVKSTNPYMMLDFFTDMCTRSYNVPEVKALLKEEFDLILYQPIYNDCVLGLIHKLKAPMVVWSPTGVYGHHVEKVGDHFPPSVIPNIFSGVQGEMDFVQRFINFGRNIAFEALLKFYYEPHVTKLYRESLDDDSIPTVSEIFRDQAAMILSNGHFSTHKPKPFFPDVVDVGGIQSRPAKPLPKDLEDFIQKGKDGFIYFSMGSALTGSKMPKEKRKMFINVFSKLKQQVIWKWETEKMPNLSSNVLLGKWLPQQDLLGHSQIKMFITHCGGGSTEEAIYHGSALLGIPLFADQHSNAKLAKSNGFMVELNWLEITEEKLMEAIQELLNNPVYVNNVKRLARIFSDQPDKPLDRAVFWVEYVIRHKGAPQLRNAGRNLNFMQYHSYDVIISYLAMITVVLFLLCKLSKLILRYIVRCVFGKDVRKPKKE